MRAVGEAEFVSPCRDLGGEDRALLAFVLIAIMAIAAMDIGWLRDRLGPGAAQRGLGVIDDDAR
jgi:hypothetical protein